MDHAGSGEERVRGDDHLIAAADAENHEGDEERVGAGREADGELRLAVLREVALEVIDALAEDEVLRGVNLFGDAEDLLAERRVLQLEVEQRNGHGRGECKG